MTEHNCPLSHCVESFSGDFVFKWADMINGSLLHSDTVLPPADWINALRVALIDLCFCVVKWENMEVVLETAPRSVSN